MIQVKCDVCGEGYEPIPSLYRVGERRFSVCFGTATYATAEPHRQCYKEIDLCPKCAKMLLTLCGIDPSKMRLPLELAQFFSSADEKEE